MTRGGQPKEKPTFAALTRAAARAVYALFGFRHRMLKQIVDNAPDGIVIQDIRGRILWCNDTYCRITGWSRPEIVGRKPQEFILPPEDRPSDAEIEAFRYTEDFEFLRNFEVIRNVRKNGEPFWNQLSFGIVRSPFMGRRVVVMVRDISEQIAQRQALEEAKQSLEAIAETDPLTGLGNRFALNRGLDALLAGGAGGIIKLDLDNFKDINDVHGHAAGDATLCHVAAAMRSAARADDLVCRIGGDEFMIVCPGIADDTLRRRAADVLERLRAPVDWHGVQIFAGASAGATTSAYAASANTMIAHADFALYEAKKEGKGRVAFYDTAMHETHRARRRLMSDLRSAMSKRSFEIVLQPIYATATGALLSFEALLRWRHPSKGLLSPGVFFGLARESGAMKDLDLIAIDLALDAAAALPRIDPGIRVAINVASETLTLPGFVDRLIALCRDKGVTSDRLVVEVHESTVIQGSGSQAAKVIQALAEAGFGVALDDFGVGNSGLATLSHLQINALKIDRSLVEGLPGQRSSRVVVQAILDVSAALGISAVAEGIETEQQLGALRAMGCPGVQGFYLSKPVPLADAQAMLTAQQSAPPRAASRGS